MQATPITADELAAAAATVAAERAALPTGPELLRAFKALLAENDYDYTIRWRWEGGNTGRRGANRDGVLQVVNSDGVKISEHQFERSTMSWGRDDERLTGLRAGSHRYHAVARAFDDVQDYVLTRDEALNAMPRCPRHEDSH